MSADRHRWNPIEHQLFRLNSRNWAGCPLGSFQTDLNSIRARAICPGLRIKVALLPDTYSTGTKIQDESTQPLNPIPADDLPA